METVNVTQAGPSPSAGPSHQRITVDGYFGMGEAGILEPDARCELIEGEIIDMPPIGAPHASKTDWLADVLTECCHGPCVRSTRAQ